MRTIRQNLDMDSHEEKLANMVKKSKLDAAKDQAKHMSQVIKQRQRDAMKTGMGGGGRLWRWVALRRPAEQRRRFYGRLREPDAGAGAGANYSSPGHEARQEEEGQGGFDEQDGRRRWTRCAGEYASGGDCGRAAAAASDFYAATDCLVRRGEADHIIVSRGRSRSVRPEGFPITD